MNTLALSCLVPDALPRNASDALPPQDIPVLSVQSTDAVRLWLDLKNAYAAVRGADAGAFGKGVPRTTNADVKQLAVRWNRELLRANAPALDAGSAMRKAWAECLMEIYLRTEGADPDAVYSANERFWLVCTKRLSIYVASLQAVPSRWELAIAPSAPRNAPEASAAPPEIPVLSVQSTDAVRLWLDLKKAYTALRGADAGRFGKAVPRTTNADVKQLATRWSTELAKAGAPALDADRAARKDWAACVTELNARTSGTDPNAVYADNERFWQVCTKRLSIYLESLKVVPSRWELATAAVKEAVAELPEAIGNASRAAAGAAASLVKEPAKLAAVLLGGALLLPPIIRAFRK